MCGWGVPYPLLPELLQVPDGCPLTLDNTPSRYLMEVTVRQQQKGRVGTGPESLAEVADKFREMQAANAALDRFEEDAEQRVRGASGWGGEPLAEDGEGGT